MMAHATTQNTAVEIGVRIDMANAVTITPGVVWVELVPSEMVVPCTGPFIGDVMPGTESFGGVDSFNTEAVLGREGVSGTNVMSGSEVVSVAGVSWVLGVLSDSMSGVMSVLGWSSTQSPGSGGDGCGGDGCEGDGCGGVGCGGTGFELNVIPSSSSPIYLTEIAPTAIHATSNLGLTGLGIPADGDKSRHGAEVDAF